MAQLRVVLAPVLEIEPGQVGRDDFAAAAQREVPTTVGQKRRDAGTRQTDAGVDDPSGDDFGDSAASGQEDVVVTKRRQRLVAGFDVGRQPLTLGLGNIQEGSDVQKN